MSSVFQYGDFVLSPYLFAPRRYFAVRYDSSIWKTHFSVFSLGGYLTVASHAQR